MKFMIQLIAQCETGEEIHELASLERETEGFEEVGITLAEAKALLVTLQKQVVKQQIAAYLAGRKKCPQCGKAFRHKDQHPLVFRTLFGNLELSGPRWFQCACQPHETRTFSPLANLLTERSSPERLYLETKWASLVSFDLAAQMLEDVLPTDTHFRATTVRNHRQRVAKRVEAGLGVEQFSYIDGCPRDWATLPLPPAPLTVGIDGGYVRQWDNKKTHFEVIVGKSIPEEGVGKCFGLVQSYDDKPKRRLFEVLKGQGMQLNQQIVFLSDGGDTVRNLQLYLNPEAEHLLDWFHVTMRLTVLHQIAKGLPMTVGEGDERCELREPALKAIESIKWYLWHGNTYEALEHLDDLEMDLDVEDHPPVGNEAKPLHMEPFADALHYGNSRFDVRGISRPHLAADRRSPIVDHNGHDHLVEVGTMILAVAKPPQFLSAISLKVDRSGVQKNQIEAAEEIAVVGEHGLLDSIFRASGRIESCMRLVFYLLTEKGHGTVKMVKGDVLYSVNAVVPAPLITEPVRPGYEKPVQDGEENRSFHVEEKEPLCEGPFEDFLDAERLPNPFKDQYRAYFLGLGADVAFSGEHEENLFRILRKGSTKGFDLSFFLQPVEPTNGAYDPLHDFAAQFFVFNDLQVLVVSRFFDSHEHGGISF